MGSRNQGEGQRWHLTPSYFIPDTEKENYDRSFFVKFWGLEEPDVEWYKLRCEEE